MRLNVIKQRSIWWAISSGIIIAGLVAMIISWTQPDIRAPLRPSLDFIGGTRLQFELDCSKPNNCDKAIDAGTVRQVLAGEGLAGSTIQVLGDDKHAVSIRTKNLNVEQRTQLQDALSAKLGVFNPKTTQIDTVECSRSTDFSAGLLALILSFVGITVYLTFRFQLDYAFFAFVALFHDVLITVGIFSILGLVLGVEVDSLFIVALLTIIGFSVNDTVVIYDRVREVISLHPDQHINQIVDDAVNQTLTRSINTTLTTLLTLTSIFLFGGETLKYFALALIVGFMAGAYSSIFIASTLLAWWRERTGKAILAPTLTSQPSDVEGST